MPAEFDQLKKDREFVGQQTTVLSEADAAKKKRNRLILTILFVILNIGAIIVTGAIEFTKDPAQNHDIPFLGVNMVYLIAAFGCLVGLLAAESYKYCVMMKYTVGKVNFKHAFEVAALGKYYDNITPSGAGGQPFQVYYLSKAGYSAGVSGSMPVTAFLSMQLSFVVLALGVFIFNGGAVTSPVLKSAAWVGLLFYLFFPVAIILFTVAPRPMSALLRGVVRLLGKIHILKHPERTEKTALDSLEAYRDSIISMAKVKYLFLKVLGLGILYQIGMCSIPFFVLRAFGGAGSFINVFTMTVFVYAAIAFVPTPGNAGAAEGTFYALFSTLTSEYLFWAMLIWRFLSYYVTLIIGVAIYGFNALAARRRRKAEAAAALAAKAQITAGCQPPAAEDDQKDGQQ